MFLFREVICDPLAHISVVKQIRYCLPGCSPTLFLLYRQLNKDCCTRRLLLEETPALAFVPPIFTILYFHHLSGPHQQIFLLSSPFHLSHSSYIGWPLRLGADIFRWNLLGCFRCAGQPYMLKGRDAYYIIVLTWLYSPMRPITLDFWLCGQYLTNRLLGRPLTASCEHTSTHH